MSLGKYQEVFAIAAARLILHAGILGYHVRLGEAYRPPEMAKIYAKRRAGIEKSQHCIKLAIDLNLFRDGKYLDKTEDHRTLGEWWEQQHPENRWGGRYDDGNHYEMVPGHVNDYWKNRP